MSFPNSSTAMAVVIVDELVRNGVDRLVLAPGSRSGALAMAALRDPRMSVSVVIDERSAAFHALGQARATGRPAAVLTTSGSAVAHLLPAVVEADAARIPMILLTADRPPELHGVGANQTIEQSGLFGAKVRLTLDIGPAEHAPDAPGKWRDAVAALVGAARTGPVHLNVAFREPLVPETDDGRDRDRPFTYDTESRPRDDQEESEEGLATSMIPERYAEVERGVVVAGEAPHMGAREVDRLAAMLGWPLIAEPTIGGRPPQTISTAHHLLADPDLAERFRPAAAVVIGRLTLSRPISAWLADVPRLVVDPRLERPPGPNAELVAAPVGLLEPLPRQGDWRRRWLDVEAVARKALDGWLDAHPGSEPAIARDTARAAARGVLLVASSMPARDLDQTMAPGAVRVVSNRGASGIDGFVSTAFGLATASDVPVTALGGDLAMLHDSNGFLVEPRADVVFVVVNNDGGGIFSFLPQHRQADVFERAFGTPHGRSFEMLAAFHGLSYASVVAIERDVANARQEGGTWILEASTDRRSNPEVHRELSRVVVEAARGSLEG